jgi:hypothetical protein
MFDVSTTVAVGSGSKTLFWKDRWLDGISIANRAPLLIQVVTKKVSRTRLVSEAMAEDRWIADISGSFSILALMQYVNLWIRLQSVYLDSQSEDKFIWKWTGNQQYSVFSACRAFFLGQCSILGARELSKGKCKFFLWTILMGRVWTAARRVHDGLQDDDACALRS